MLSEKMRPTKLAALIGNETQRLALAKWLKRWKVGSKAVLLMGPPGVGKSTSVYAAAEEYGYNVIEYNASDLRSKSALSEALGPSLQNASLFGEEDKLLVFLDEVDGVSGRSDYAGSDFILEFAENSSVPVAMAANVEDDPKLKKLQQKSLVLKFSPIDERLVYIYLKWIVKKENLEISEEWLRQIARSSRGDVRFALNSLQASSAKYLSLAETDRQYFSDSKALDEILSSSSIREALARLRTFDASPQDRIRAIFDAVVSSKRLSIKEREGSIKLISEADILLQQMMKHQRWRLLRYFDRYLALAIVSKQLMRTDSSIPWNLKLSIWNDGRVIKEFLQELPNEYHVGKSTLAIEYLPYIAFCMKNNPEELSRFMEKHDFGDSEKRVLLKIANKR